jgi:dolichol kinase
MASSFSSLYYEENKRKKHLNNYYFFILYVLLFSFSFANDLDIFKIFKSLQSLFPMTK